MPTSTNYFEFVIDPSTGNQIEVRDKYAREQLVHKTEKTVVNSLPAKPTTYDAWLAMERFIYFVPIDGEENQYEAWTLFFIGDSSVPADYTDTDNYEWVQIAVTDTDLTNFSTKGHTHEVIPETEVEDHDYTPQGTVSGSFTGNEGTTVSDGSHQHSFTPAGSVSSSFSGTEGTTSNDGSHTHSFTPAGSVSSSFSGSAANTDSVSDHKHSFTPSGTISGSFTGNAGNTGSDGVHNHTLTKTAKKLSTKKLSVAPATSVNFTGSTTNAQRATGALETLSSYDASKAVFNGIDVTDGVLSFVTKKMTTADTVSGLSATIDASKVTYNGSGTATNEDVATGALSDPASGDPTVLADASVDNSTGHTHTFTPSGSVAATFSGTSDETGDAGGHQHSYTPSGTVTSSFSGTSDDTGSAGGHTHTLTPAGSVTSSFSGTEGNTGSAGSHTHAFTPSGGVAASFSGLRANLKHKVDNKKVRTSPDSEDEGSHAYDWYGILFDEDEDDPQKTRVGNMDMHRMLPIQTKMRRCLLKDDGTVYNYLDENDSTRYANGSLDINGNDIGGQIAELKGAARSTYGDDTSEAFNVQVMVEYPEHWRKVYTYLDGTKTMVKAMVSPYPQETTGWIHVKKGYISAYEANIDANNKLCSTSDIKDLVLSVVNGKVNATCDVSVIGETGAPADWSAYIAGTHSLFPTTSVNMATLRTDARARHSIDGAPDTRWNMLVYEQYLALYWLYVIEYANLNSQAAVNVALDYDGFHQGGLGDGVTTVNSTAWNNFNSYKPFVPCGITNCLGNHSGEVILALPSAFGTNIKVSVNSYRGVEMPFGHIWKFADGIKYLGDGTQQAVLRCGTPANYSSDSNSNNYTSIGNSVGSNGYKKKIMIGDDGDINCKAVGGGALKAYCDYNYQAHENGSYYCSLLGGSANDGTLAGLAYVLSSNGLAHASSRIGSRLCFIDV